MDSNSQFSYTSIGSNNFSSEASYYYPNYMSQFNSYPYNLSYHYNYMEPSNSQIKVNGTNSIDYNSQFQSPMATYSSEQYTPITNATYDPKTYYPTPPSDAEFERNTTKNYKINQTLSPINTKTSPNTSLDDSIDKKANKRRSRTQFTKYQLEALEKTFQKNHYPDVQMVDRLSDTLGLAIERISVWFQNRRAKYKKVKKPSKLIDDNYTNMKSIDTSIPYQESR
jgi:hypothetical protein